MKFYVCGKYESEESRKNLKEVGNNPLFGYNWWLWVPRLKRDALGWEFQWLNFWIEF